MNNHSRFWLLVFSVNLIMLPCKFLFSQVIQNEVVATSGDAQVIDNKSISWTLGEVVIEPYSSGNILLTQGFNQPSFIFLEVPESDTNSFLIKIYPNPASRFTWVEIIDVRINEKYTLNIIDSEGRPLRQRQITPRERYQVDLDEFPEGMLLFNIIRISDNSNRSFKIIRFP